MNQQLIEELWAERNILFRRAMDGLHFAKYILVAPNNEEVDLTFEEEVFKYQIHHR
jgi:hypothetical protein